MNEQSQVPQIKRPSDALWLIGLGGALVLGFAIAMTLKPPKEAPAAKAVSDAAEKDKDK